MPLLPVYKSDPNGLPLQAKAILLHNNMDGGQAAGLNPPGFVSGGCPHHHQRGHLIGNDIGGKNDLRNLVTLTDGSNHPYMFAIERIVRNIVTKTKVAYIYTVDVDYDKSNYSMSPNHTAYGALGNPYCSHPAPGRLLVSLQRQSDQKEMFGDMNTFITYDDPHFATANYMSSMVQHGRVVIANGMYKQHANLSNHLPGCPSLVSVSGEKIKCHVCPAEGGTVAKEPSTLDWLKSNTCWHWCQACSKNWCPTHGYGLKSAGYFTMSRQCSICNGLTQLFVPLK